MQTVNLTKKLLHFGWNDRNHWIYGHSYIKQNIDGDKTLVTDYFEKTLNKNVIDSIAGLEGTTYMLGRAKDVNGGEHWVVLEGYTMNNMNQVEFIYNATSKNDVYQNRKYILGSPSAAQTNNVYQIDKIETYTIK